MVIELHMNVTLDITTQEGIWKEHVEAMGNGMAPYPAVPVSFE